MSNINIFQYTGNLFKKSLETYASKLKKNVSKYLENNDLEKAKAIIKKIEGITKFQKEIDSILQNYFEQFPEEKPLIEKSQPSQNPDNNYIHYTSEILEIIWSTKQIEIFELKTSLYNEIVNHISSIEISNNKKIPQLLNWEICFYKSVTFLLSKKLIQFSEDDWLILTEKGTEFLGDDFEIEYLIDDSNENINNLEVVDETFNGLIEKDEDLDLISSIRSYLLSNLISDGTLMADDDSNFYEQMFYIIKELYNVEGQLIESWSQIQENNYYLIKSYFGSNEHTVFVREKNDRYNILECIDEDNSRTYYAFI